MIKGIMEDEPAFSWLLHVERGIGHAMQWVGDHGTMALSVGLIVFVGLVMWGTMLVMIGRDRGRREGSERRRGGSEREMDQLGDRGYQRMLRRTMPSDKAVEIRKKEERG